MENFLLSVHAFSKKCLVFLRFARWILEQVSMGLILSFEWEESLTQISSLFCQRLKPTLKCMLGHSDGKFAYRGNRHPRLLVLFPSELILDSEQFFVLSIQLSSQSWDLFVQRLADFSLFFVEIRLDLGQLALVIWLVLLDSTRKNPSSERFLIVYTSKRFLVIYTRDHTFLPHHVDYWSIYFFM